MVCNFKFRIVIKMLIFKIVEIYNEKNEYYVKSYLRNCMKVYFVF